MLGISFSCSSSLHSKGYGCVIDLCKMFLLGIINFAACCCPSWLSIISMTCAILHVSLGDESFTWIMSLILGSFIGCTLWCLLSNWLLSPRFNRQWFFYNSQNCSRCLCSFSSFLITPLQCSPPQHDNWGQFSHLHSLLSVLVYQSLYLWRESVQLSLFGFCRSLSTYINGPVLITASALVNVLCNWDLFRLTLPILFPSDILVVPTRRS